MKSGIYKFKLTEKSVQDFYTKYRFDRTLFRTINGSYNKSFYKEYRVIQKQLLKQLLLLNNIEYKKQNLIENMYLNYKDEVIEINFHQWVPVITIVISRTTGCLRSYKKISITNCNVENEVELLLS